MLQQFENHIRKNFPFLKEKRLLVTVSGGIDSMVLLYLCHQLQLNFAAAHCNFQLRGDESDGDEQFVRTLCQELHIPVFVEKFVTEAFAAQHKLSIQVVARKLRYDWFETILQNHDYDYILTAHHLDDSLETFLINFTRGTGLDGLTGIPEQNDKIIRPLLIFSREEIITFAKENKVPWREDSSNATDKYLRNKLRHQIIPALKELNSGLLQSFEKTTEHLKQAQSLVDDASLIVFQNIVEEADNQLKINIQELIRYKNHNAYIYQWLKPMGFTDWTAVYDLIDAQSGKQVFSDTHVVLKDRNHLIVYPIQQVEETVYLIKQNQADVKVPLKMTFCKAEAVSVQTTNTIFVDEAKLQFPLQVRKWQEGDVFYPLGMNGKKKVSKFFKDEKTALPDKLNTWLLCSENQIVWIIGKRADDRFKITNQTTSILQIQLQE
ncbi:tRNA lysidine(34) synthetase TilS [Flavobacterium silvisoli]|uniref:tRNA(Ile)-lysidine synthase n=1 Tax=Flavobacterium silvisoli TaxID=2529433 RepID=A0A4Q9Z1M4_9FLAO|nr:tRNA lysidine(34) synthetase TilS [Flavobacterium silvisoli]TBX70170.1 tRNA lysidine(34) synthetase TilS [Flavobacterium silvisoli]